MTFSPAMREAEGRRRRWRAARWRPALHGERPVDEPLDQHADDRRRRSTPRMADGQNGKPDAEREREHHVHGERVRERVGEVEPAGHAQDQREAERRAGRSSSHGRSRRRSAARPFRRQSRATRSRIDRRASCRGSRAPPQAVSLIVDSADAEERLRRDLAALVLEHAHLPLDHRVGGGIEGVGADGLVVAAVDADDGEVRLQRLVEGVAAR